MRRLPLLYLCVPVLIAVSALLFCGTQLSHAFPFGGPGIWGAWAWACALWIFPLVRMLFYRHSTSKVQGLGFFMLGLGSTFTILLLILKLVEALAGLAHWFFPIWAPWAVLAMAMLLVLGGMQEAFGTPRVRTIHLPVPGLHPGLEGLRIAQISDVHVSHLNGPGQIRRLVERTLSLKPDLIAVTGDLIDGPWETLRRDAAVLGALEAPLGVHYITGNHEYYWDTDQWLREFKGMGFNLLLNEHRVLEREGGRLLVVGVNDYTAKRFKVGAGPDLEAALRGAPEADFTLFLAHQPQAFDLAQAAKADLFLAGHTHGGQFYPFPPIVSLFHRFFRGLYQKEGQPTIYVHPGSGFWGPPNRLGVPPEVALFILERPKA